MPAIRNIPQNMMNDFTMGGKVEIIDYWFDDSAPCNNGHYYNQQNVKRLELCVLEGKSVGYVDTDQWLYQALRKYPIKGKTVLVVGSEMPTYEGIILAYGGKPITIEHKKIETDNPDLCIMTVAEYEKIENPELYDCAFSISSEEHNGLSRYGENLDPWGDIKSMEKLKKMIKPGGLVFLAIPVGTDKLYWNGGREYGILRFPMLIKEWTLLESFGFTKMDLLKEYGSYLNIAGQIRYNYHQPLHVLKNV